MLCCIAAPRTPRFAAREQLRGRESLAEEPLGVAEDADVGGGKGVRMMKATERDVLRGPLTDARDGTEAADALFQRAGGLEDLWMSGGCARKRDERGPACCGHTESSQVSGRELLCVRKSVGEDGVSERDWLCRERDKLSREPPRGCDAD